MSAFPRLEKLALEHPHSDSQEVSDEKKAKRLFVVMVSAVVDCAKKGRLQRLKELEFAEHGPAAPLKTVQRLLAKDLLPSLTSLTLPSATESTVADRVKARFDQLKAD